MKNIGQTWKNGRKNGGRIIQKDGKKFREKQVKNGERKNKKKYDII